ncbi:MAG: 3-oxoacyl-ACP reductase [Oceanospirillaceae bacterium]|uniref:SDR family oxidoreductase n=3 Tax=unclassified Thalassolituus TaxID=2624967 RepID=UPI000C09E0D0|nr:SDR family oxidoreductase [Thalassolituus sp. UBA6592]MAK90008.1 3-oxoacyl-ACP reductase [Thalassolituus sp.]MAS25630.1 3-oxoacyl-ACP reductase [Oceanospirillaceae bacterium]MAX98782.1 3-oxoacyl-ACP reductase [Oceanospirillaceae bacterium]MBL35690.1 3-oxoacyl-ACP reductase [Oceanospirillaceae bacterium]MBS52219.1 3-oxoacyl-ACP reductase [Oceanospirillaceae bacterium]|tara:strand:- start:8022 stop:8780 length:759 start_codon:yes stop_codon:yes gene_type:complete
MKLQNKVIAITGSGQGLGRAMAVHLAKEGAQIAVIDLNQEHMDETKAQVEAAGSKAATFVCNVADEAQVEQTFQAVSAQMGGLHGLINNAGILRDGLMIKAKDGEVKKMSLAQWQAVIDVNLTGVFLCGREAAEQMIKTNEGGCIINISSIARAGNFGQTNYSAAKAGVAAMAVTWAKELARYNIRANAIAPGFIATEMTASMKPEALEKICAGIPAGRMGSPDEIGDAAVFLLANDYMSGRIIEVDGGLRL